MIIVLVAVLFGGCVGSAIRNGLASAEQGCRSGHRDQCFIAGYDYSAGVKYDGTEYIAKNTSRAEELYWIGCHAGADIAIPSCTGLTVMAQQSEKSDLKRAINLYRKICHEGIGAACIREAELENDPASALAIYRRLCKAAPSATTSREMNAGSQACSALGTAYALGKGVPVDRLRSAKLEIIATTVRLEASELGYAEDDREKVRSDREARQQEQARQDAAEQSERNSAQFLQVLGAVQQGITTIQTNQIPGNAEIAEMHKNVEATLALHKQQTEQSAALHAKEHAAETQRQIAAAEQRQIAAQQQAQQAAADKAQKDRDEAARKEAERKAALATCMAHPVSRTRVAQTNPFRANVQGFETLLTSANACVGKPWKECMFSASMNPFWAVEDRAEEAHVDMFRRLGAPGVYLGDGADTCLNGHVAGTRDDCEADISNERFMCLSRLKDDIKQMECDETMLPNVWDAENRKRDTDAEAARDAQCHSELGQ